MARTSVKTPPLSKNRHLLRWVEKIAELTTPADIHWVDGSKEENEATLPPDGGIRHLP